METLDQIREDYVERAVELLRLHDPNYDLDDPDLALAIAQEMMKVRAETLDLVYDAGHNKRIE